MFLWGPFHNTYMPFGNLNTTLRHLNCQFFVILNAQISNISKISSKHAAVWHLKCQICFLKLVIENWHLNTKIWGINEIDSWGPFHKN